MTTKRAALSMLATGSAICLTAAVILVHGCGTKEEAQPPAEEVPQAQLPEEMEDTDAAKTEVTAGDRVQVHYRGTLSDGSVFDESSPDRPLVFVAGAGQMIPGFDKAVLGMKLNEEKTVTIPAAEAYGDKNKSMITNVPRTSFPPDFDAAVGELLQLRDGTGRTIRGRLVSMGSDSVRIDFNHPLAGEDLTFSIKVVGIE